MDFNQIKSVPIFSYITVSLRRYLNPDMFYYAIKRVTSYPALHPAIQDQCFTSSQCLQERVEEKTNNPATFLYTLCFSACFKSQWALIFSCCLQIPKCVVHLVVNYSCKRWLFCRCLPFTSLLTSNDTFIKYQGNLQLSLPWALYKDWWVKHLWWFLNGNILNVWLCQCGKPSSCWI